MRGSMRHGVLFHPQFGTASSPRRAANASAMAVEGDGCLVLRRDLPLQREAVLECWIVGPSGGASEEDNRGGDGEEASCSFHFCLPGLWFGFFRNL